MKPIISLVFAFVILLTGIPLAKGGALDDENFSGTMTIATDYVAKGISFSDTNPVVQGSFDYYNPVGIWAGFWASSTDGRPTTTGEVLSWTALPGSLRSSF